MTNRGRVPLLQRRSAAAIVWMLLFPATVVCEGEGLEQSQDGEPMPEKTITQVLSERTDSLLSLPGVVGAGQGVCEAKPCIKVLVASSTPELLREIPSTIDGYAVDIQETGEFRTRWLE